MITDPFSDTPTDLIPSQCPLRRDQILWGVDKADLILEGLVVDAEDGSESSFLTLTVKRSPRLETAAMVSPPAVIDEIWLEPPQYLIVRETLGRW